MEPIPEQHRDGTSMVPFLEDPEQAVQRTLLWHYPHYHGSDWRPGAAIRDGNWKLIEFFEDQTVELYDLEQDLGERADLTGTYPEVAERLRIRLHKDLDAMGARYPLPRE